MANTLEIIKEIHGIINLLQSSPILLVASIAFAAMALGGFALKVALVLAAKK
jgi:hypothetical protein